MLQKIILRLRALWQLALSERATPREIGLAIGLGVALGCTPLIGFHGWIAFGLATLFRLSRLWTFMGSRFANFITIPWIALVEVQLAHRLRTGTWAPLTIDTVLDHARELLLDWCLGLIPVAIVLGSLFGFLAYLVARARLAKLARAQKNDSEAPTE